MPKIKLAFVTHGLSANGIESFLVNLTHFIDMEKYDVTFVIALDKDTIPLHEETVKSLGAKVIHTCDLDSMKKKFQYSAVLEKVFKENRFDIVHTNMDLLNGMVLTAAKKAGIKKRICHSHTSSSTFLSENSSSILNLVQKLYKNLMQSLILKNATDLLGCSEKANNYLYGKSSKKSVIINNGINTKLFSQADKICLSDKKINLVTVGRLASPKNPLFIVDVIKELSLLRQDFVFNWAGDGSMREEIENHIQKNGVENYFNMLGRRTDIPEILNSCSYFLLPSLFEGLPVSLVEAQSAGLYCFVSDSVTKEVDMGGCKFISLDLGAEKWADIINEAINSNTKPNISQDKLLKFDITYTVKQLDEIYCK